MNVENENDEGDEAAAIDVGRVSDTWIVTSEANDAWQFQCCWGSACQERVTDVDALRHHVLAHLNAQLATGLLMCKVRGCEFEGACAVRLRRHVLFHVYQAGLQEKGVRLIQRDARLGHFGDCCFSRLNSNDYAGHSLACQWLDCDRSFEEFDVFFTHVTLHANNIDTDESVDGRMKCLWHGCAHTVSRRNHLRDHLRHHSGEKRVACPFCGSTFYDTRTKLCDHLLRQNSTTENSRLRCFVCQKMFSSERLLREHSRRHVKHYKCPLCDMTVETPSDLRKHIRQRHSGERTDVCTFCNRGFVGRHNLERHMQMVHLASEQRFSCLEEACTFSCKSKYWLRRHEKTHKFPGGKPYLCHLCAAGFARGTLLSQHLVSLHSIALPSGHTRFSYKKCADGYHRLQTERYESPELAARLQKRDDAQTCGPTQYLICLPNDGIAAQDLIESDQQNCTVLQATLEPMAPGDLVVQNTTGPNGTENSERVATGRPILPGPAPQMQSAEMAGPRLVINGQSWPLVFMNSS